MKCIHSIKLARQLQFVIILLMGLFIITPVFAEDATPIGVWLDASKRIAVKVTGCGEFLCGKLLWFKWPDDAQGLPVVDLKNKKPELRNRPLLGLVILRNLRAEEDVWKEGEIYNPDDGENYHVNMSIEDDRTLRVHVYDLLPIFGETHIWTRIPERCIAHLDDNYCSE